MHCRKTVGIFFNRFSARNRSVPRWEFVQSFVKLPTCQMASGDWNWPGGLGPPSRSVFPGIPTKTFSCILTYLHTAYIFLKKTLHFRFCLKQKILHNSTSTESTLTASTSAAQTMTSATTITTKEDDDFGSEMIFANSNSLCTPLLVCLSKL